jgi:asparagine synthase (glutamine-hydrolysing)
LQKDAGNILIHLRSAANPILMKNLMRLPDIRLSDRKNIVTECIERAEGDLINAMLFYDQRTHLCTLLDRQDKMCMGASIESRVPLLDVKLFNFINSLPSNIKTERGNKKRLFRNAMKGKLPDNILYRPKYPFGVPLERYFIDSKQNHHIINKIFNESVLVKKNIVDPKILGSLIRKFLNGNNIHADLIWNFVNLELWYRIFISKEIIQSEFIL